MALVNKYSDFFGDMDRMMGQLANSVWGNFPTLNTLNSQYSSYPMDIVEHNDHFEIVADVPGFTGDDITIDEHDGYLSISGERKIENVSKDGNGRVHRKERYYNKFSRAFTLPDNVDTNDIVANVKHGVLKVSIPKKETPPKNAARRIKVN